jgi:hypothetical protein
MISWTLIYAIRKFWFILPNERPYLVKRIVDFSLSKTLAWSVSNLVYFQFVPSELSGSIFMHACSVFFCQSSVVLPWLSFYLWLSMMIFFRGFRMICWLCMQVIRVYIVSWEVYINLSVNFLCFLNGGWTPGLYSQFFVYANFLIWGVNILYFMTYIDVTSILN